MIASPIQERREQLGLSRDQVARKLYARYRDKTRSARSLVQEIRKLEQGQVTWFDKRRDAAQHLADILGVDIAMLGLPNREELVFQGFPELPALPLGTKPFGADWWQTALEKARTGPVWVNAPAGAGKTFFARWADHGRLATWIAAPTLEVAAKIAGRTDMVIVELAARSPEDLVVATRLARAGLVIMAPFPRPRERPVPGGNPDAIENDTNATAHQPHAATDAAVPGRGTSAIETEPQWTDLAWSEAEFNREAFVAWLTAGRTTPRAAVVLWARLVAFDPDGTLVATPKDIVEFLGALYEEGSSARSDVAKTVLLRLARRGESSWLHRHVQQVFRELVERRWLDVTFPVGAAVPRTAWEAYLPDELVPPKDKRQLTKELRNLRADSSVSIEDVAERLQNDRGTAVGILEKAGILSEGPTDEFTLEPRWLAQEVILDELAKLVVKDPSRYCAPAVCPSRRPILDAVLDRLDERQFTRFLKQTRAYDAGDLGQIAAIEAAFAAVARRTEWPRGVDLSRLLDQQLSVLVEHYDGVPPGPVTRPAFGSDFGANFVADCWVWSLRMPAPAGHEHDAWLFPGWTPKAPTSMPTWLGHPNDPRTIDHLQKAFAELLGRWTPTVFAGPRRWMVPSLLVAADEWSVRPDEARALLEPSVAESLLKACKSLEGARRAEVIRRVWALGSHLQFEALGLLGGSLGEVLLPYVATLPMPSWVPIASLNLGRVPSRLRGLIMKWLVDEGDNAAGADIWNQVEHLGADDAALLVRLAARDRGWHAIQRLWQVAPDAAKRELETRLESATIDTTTGRWIAGTPPKYLDHVVERIEERFPEPPECPQWLRRWAAHRMLDAPAFAERLLRFVRSAATTGRSDTGG